MLQSASLCTGPVTTFAKQSCRPVDSLKAARINFWILAYLLPACSNFYHVHTLCTFAGIVGSQVAASLAQLLEAKRLVQRTTDRFTIVLNK